MKVMVINTYNGMITVIDGMIGTTKPTEIDATVIDAAIVDVDAIGAATGIAT